MKKNIVIVIIVLIIILLFITIPKYLSDGETIKDKQINNDVIKNEIEEGEKEMDLDIKVIINNNTYNVKLEDNETTREFINMLPQEFNMSELNGNEKYVYLDTTLPTNSYSPNRIEAGDIMLFGNNCLVVFYKSFNTSYTYTKIGHIEDMKDLGNENMIVKFEK